MFFPIGIIRRSAVTAMQQPSTSRSIFCVFGSFASSLSRHLAYRAAVVANIMGLRPPSFVLKRHSRRTLWYDLLQRSIPVSAAVAPVPRSPLVEVHDLSPLSVVVLSIIHNHRQIYPLERIYSLHAQIAPFPPPPPPPSKPARF